MFITKSLTKKNLEDLIKQSFQFLTFSQASSLGDSLKGLGFYYATASGISISLDDLKTPASKKELVTEIEKDFEEVSRNWTLGLVSDVERFQSVIDNWNLGAEILKHQIINHFQLHDPLNTLYIMAFSGARGNMSQVRQVIGMRGLMVNQEGDIIDLPIQTNFREGLSSIDYIVSSYGARKGVVDTALKTADAGYLTRRLIYIVQEITIKAIDCKTSKSLSVILTSKSSLKDLLGKTSIKITDLLGKPIDFPESNSILTESLLLSLKKKGPLTLFYRSAITCKFKNGICQSCYGWDLSKREKIDLGLAVGIVAAQSIGEPGTQLTMRTFHTGGVFTGQFAENQTSPFSGKFELPHELKVGTIRTSHGKSLPLLLEDITASITTWDGKKSEIFIPRSSFLHFKESSFIKKGQIISELQKESKIVLQKKRHPVRAPFDGLILNKKLSARFFRSKKLKITKKNSTLWLASGQVYQVSYAEFLKKQFLNQKNAFARSKIVAPFAGILTFDNVEQKIRISNKFRLAELNFDQLGTIKFSGKFQNLTKNFQFIDTYSILGFYYYYPLINEKIYRVKTNIKKRKTTKNFFFFITEKDIWKINFDNQNLFDSKEQIIFPDNLLTPTLESPSSGILLEKNGFQHIYQKAVALFFPQSTLLSTFQGKFLKKNQVLAFLVLSKQKGEDIVQGLPKVEELLEARKVKKPAVLFSAPSIFLGNWRTNSTKPNQKPLGKRNSQNVFYRVDIIPNSEEEFNLVSKIRKLPLNSTDRRSIRRVQKKRFLLLNFFQGIISDNNHFHYKNTSYEMIPIRKMDTFNFFSEDFSSILGEKKIDFLQSSSSTIDTIFSSKKKLSEKNLEYNRNEHDHFLFLDQEKENRDNLLMSFPFIRLPKFAKFPKKTNFSLKQIKREFSKEISSNLGQKLFDQQKSKILSSSSSINPIVISAAEVFSGKKVQQFEWYRLQSFDTGYSHFLPLRSKVKIKLSEFIDIGRPLTQGRIDPHLLLTTLFYYHYNFEGLIRGSYRSIYKLQLILLNSIQSVYRSQGVEIANIHIELILRELTSKVKVKFSQNELFYSNEIVSLRSMIELCEVYNQERKREIFYEPILVPISKASLQKDGFLAAAGFQETRFVLTKAAIEGQKDWIRGLKESIIIGRLIPAGTGFLAPKNYLDSLFYYKSI